MRKSNKKIFAVLLFFTFMIGAAFPAFAEFKLLDAIQEFGEKRFVKTTPTRWHAGPVAIHPTLRKSVTYDSNVLLQPDDQNDDVVFNLQPGVILELPINKHQLAVGYEADFEIFSKARNANQTDQNQNFFALADFQFPSWYINILETFSETSGRSGTTFTERIPRYDQTVYPKIGYKFKRFTFETGFRHTVRDFRRKVDGAIDFHVQEWSEVIYYDLFARLKALFETQVGEINYNHNHQRDGFIYQTRLGLEGELMPNLKVKARSGIQLRNYYKDANVDFRSWIADVRADYQVRPSVKVYAGFSRQPVEATFGDVNYFLEHAYFMGAEYTLLTKWKLYTEPRYVRDSYSERVEGTGRTGFRRDHHWEWKTGLQYLIQEWWSMELAYEYLRRNSNFSDFDYTDNRVSLTSKLAY